MSAAAATAATVPDVDPAGLRDVDVPGDSETVEPLCPDVQTWVEHVYAPTFPRKISQNLRWCSRWWAHPEAIVRLTALWQTWEAARLVEDGSGMADWLRSYLDALNPVLLAPDGPFASCTPDRHSEPATLPVAVPPAGYWTQLDPTS